MFENIMRGITHALCEYGMWSAGLFSAHGICLLYTSPSPRDYAASRMPSSA